MQKERPILFSAPMVRAILEGRKTQTRRIVRPQPENGISECLWVSSGLAHKSDVGTCSCREIKCKYGHVGDRLWVRETFATPYIDDDRFNGTTEVFYRADGETSLIDKWKPSIFMPRLYSRIDLEITGVCAEQLQDITQEGAEAEGATPKDPRILYDDYIFRPDFRGGFIDLWKSINGPGSWDANP